jgi:hypothetical protein
LVTLPLPPDKIEGEMQSPVPRYMQGAQGRPTVWWPDPSHHVHGHCGGRRKLLLKAHRRMAYSASSDVNPLELLILVLFG